MFTVEESKARIGRTRPAAVVLSDLLTSFHPFPVTFEEAKPYALACVVVVL